MIFGVKQYKSELPGESRVLRGGYPGSEYYPTFSTNIYTYNIAQTSLFDVTYSSSSSSNTALVKVLTVLCRRMYKISKLKD